MRKILALAAVIAVAAPALRAEVYDIDPGYSHVGFRVLKICHKAPGRGGQPVWTPAAA